MVGGFTDGEIHDTQIPKPVRHEVGTPDVAGACVDTVPGSPALAADEPDLIFRRSTVFKWVSPNDKLATYGVDDPEAEGVAADHALGRRGYHGSEMRRVRSVI